MNQTFNKKKFFEIIFITLGFLLLYACSIYLIDPLQQFRIAKHLKPVYTNEECQNPGLAKNVHYDTVLIGSSMLQNFRSSYVKKRLGWQTLKLSISGASSYEEIAILKTAIQTGQVKNVVFGIDILRMADNEIREGFPLFLYSSHSILDRLKYLLNIANINFIVKNTLNSLKIHKGTDDLDAAYIASDKNNYSAEDVKRVFQNQLIFNGEKGITSLTDMKINFDKNILTTIKNNPDIHFYLFFPPYSVYLYKLYEHKEILDVFLEMKKYIFEKTKNLPNVKLYDFQTETKITAQLNNYYDISHYSEDVANFMIDNLQNTTYLVTSKNSAKLLARHSYLHFVSNQ